MANYPTSLDTFTTKQDGVDDVLASHVNDLQSALVAVQTELGTSPSGTFANVVTRLSSLLAGWTLSEDLDLNGHVITTLPNSTGWTAVSDSWAYASATTITVPSGAASIYSLGDKIKFQNNSSGTFLYCEVKVIADTLLTVSGDAVPNATLTDKYYSKFSNPVGSNQGVFSGVYTPSLTNTTNVAASTAFEMPYFRVGKLCYVMGQVNIDTTTTGNTLLTMSLPISSTLALSTDLNGLCGTLAGETGIVYASTATNEAIIRYTAVATANTTWTVSFMYAIV